MKNDFDFIKDQIDNSGVKAPAHMDESYVLEKLADVQPDTTTQAQPEAQPKVVPLHSRKRIGWIAGIAAAIVVAGAVGTAVSVHLHNAGVAVPPPGKGTGLVQFTNYDQVRNALHLIDERSGSYRYSGGYDYIVEEDAAMSPAPGSGATGSASGGAKGAATTTDTTYAGNGAAHSDTYKQVEGVDEADIIKTDGRYIYVVEHSYSDDRWYGEGGVEVFPAAAGTENPILKIIPGETGSTQGRATPDEEDIFSHDGYYQTQQIDDIFLKDNRLIILSNDYTHLKHVLDDGYDYENVTRAYVYDVADMDHVTLLDTYTQSGNYTSSRMIGDTLYLITTEYGAADIPVCGRGSTPDQIPADCIYSVENPQENTFLIVSSYDTLNHSADSDSKAILGTAEDVYCNEENLYITATEYHYSYTVDIDYYDGAVSDAEGIAEMLGLYSAENDEDRPPTTRIYKVSLSDGVTFTAYGEVEGYIDSQYSLDEYNGCLRVAATTENEDYDQTNNLYVLDGELNIIGSVTGFANDEHIEAVRYVGETAYVITYRTTDPLFVIDLSDPTAPAILGEVKITGFSTMLVPLDDHTILGLGYSTDDYATYDDIEVQDGLKLALFDVSDPMHPQVLDSRSYLNCSSEVRYNPKALVYNADRGDFVIPLNYYYGEYDEDTDEYVSESYGGMLNFAVRDGKLVEIDRYRSAQRAIDRCVYAGDTVYMTYTDDYGKVYLESVNYK